MAIAVLPRSEPVVDPSNDPARVPLDDAVAAVAELVAAGRPLTWHDLQQLPDGLRFELVDGVLLVSPSPLMVHQRIASNLVRLLHDAVPPALEVLFAPFDWYVSETTVFQPDVLVCRTADLSERWLGAPPVLGVEILSPSTRLRDVGLKRRAYEDAGLGWYWVIDPEDARLTVHRLDRGGDRRAARYVEEVGVSGDEAYVASDPFAVTVVPSGLMEAGGRVG